MCVLTEDAIKIILGINSLDKFVPKDFHKAKKLLKYID